MSSRKPRAQAAKGSITTAILVRLPEDLAKLISKFAKIEGCSEAEWVRRAARDRSLRQEGKRMGVP